MFLLSLALAVPPDKIAAKIDTGGNGDVDQLVISEDGELVVGLSQSDHRFFVMEIDAWTIASALPCTVSAVTVVPLATYTNQIVAGCSDGTVTTYTYDRSATENKLSRDGDDQGSFTWNVSTNGGSLEALWWDGALDDPYVYAFEDGATLGYMHVLGLNTVDSTDADLLSTYPTPTGTNGVSDAVTNFDLGVGYLAHGSSRISTINFNSGVTTYQPLVSGVLYDYDDLGAGLVQLWAVDTGRSFLLQLDSTTGTVTGTYPTVSNAKAVVEGGTIGDSWLLVSGDGLRVHQMSNGSISDLNDPYYSSDSAEINIQDAVANSEWAFGGGEAGKLQVITARPWIHDSATVSPASATDGDTVTLTFNVDEDSSWQVCLNGVRTSCSDELASGEATGIDADALGTASGDAAAVSVEVEVTTDFREGTNHLYVLATDAAGNIGHRRLELVVDNPPTTPSLPEGALGFADEALVLSFDAIDDEDLASFEIYISDVPFTREDFDDPDFVPADPEVEDGPTNPIVIDASPGQSVTTTIAPLDNAGTYYVALRAIDEGGLESEMSNVVTGSPEETYTAAQLAGETGGGPCSTGATGPVFWGGLVGLFGLVARRRRATRVWLQLAALALGILAVSTPALADDDEDRGDITKQYGNFELRYGGFLNLQDDAITSVFGGGQNMLQVEVGPQITRFFELDVEAGFYQELATTVTANDAASAKRTMLTMFPLGLSVSGRLQIIDEQIVVPYGRYGVDFVYWTELTDNSSGGKDKVQGTKVGQHFAVGAGLLLDIFAPRRASLLEAYSGINDTYLTFEFRRQMVDSRAHPWAAADTSGFSFTGNMVTVGLKLDY